MPNYVKNKIIVGRKDYIKRLTDKYCELNSDTNELEFDFNKVIQMPKDLQIEFSSKSDEALCLYLTRINPNVLYYGTNEDKISDTRYQELIKKLTEKLLMNHDFTLKEASIAKLLNKYHEDELLELGNKQVSNLKEYGAINWYEWSINNWGTKWNASNFEVLDDYTAICFETAWNPAIPVVLEISRQNPNIKFAYLYSDEAIGSHVGYMLMHSGKVDFKGEFDDFTFDAYKLAFDLWGCEDDYIFDERINNFILKDEKSKDEVN